MTVKDFKALSVFKAKPLPMAIFDADGNSVTGPFCAHCGFSELYHVTGKVRGGTHKGETITACPPPNGINPMDGRCPACTLKDMHLAVSGSNARHVHDNAGFEWSWTQ